MEVEGIKGGGYKGWSKQNLVCAISQLNRIQNVNGGGHKNLNTRYNGAIGMMWVPV